MKFLQTIMAWIALFALMLPCVCVAEHCHAEVEHADQFSVEHTCCQACHEEPCSTSEKTPLQDASPSADVPVRQIQRLPVFKIARPILVAAPCSSGELQCLRTIQLLI